MAKWRECFSNDSTGDELFTNDFRSSCFGHLKLTEFEEYFIL